MKEITYKQFARVMAKRKRTVDDLVDIFRGKIDNARASFDIIMSCQWRNPDTGRYEDRSWVVIPYRSLIAFYDQELHFLEDSAKKVRDPQK